jgi:hypothetical protein
MFAVFYGKSRCGCIAQIERGTKRPSGAVLVLLNLIRRKGHRGDPLSKRKMEPQMNTDERRYNQDLAGAERRQLLTLEGLIFEWITSVGSRQIARLPD